MTERASGMTEGTVEGKGGLIYTHTWEIDEARGGVVVVHGYGEHIGRYEHVAKALNDAGWSVYGLDHTGHGRSEGERVLIPDFTPVVEDVHTVVGQAQAANSAADPAGFCRSPAQHRVGRRQGDRPGAVAARRGRPAGARGREPARDRPAAQRRGHREIYPGAPARDLQ
jgi:pimeloyl-ACP methyl ester carboxylesterase